MIAEPTTVPLTISTPSGPLHITLSIAVSVSSRGVTIAAASPDAGAPAARIADILDPVCDELAAQDYRPTTVRRIRSAVSVAARRMSWEWASEITPEAVRSYIREQHGSATGTRRSMIGSLQTFTKAAAALGIIDAAPDLSALQVKDRDEGAGVRALTLEEIGRLLDAAGREETDRAKYADRKRYRQMVYRFLIYTAARKGEAMKARWREFDLDAAEWRIPAEHTKNRRSAKLNLHPVIVGVLRDYRANDCPEAGPLDPVFPTFPGNDSLRRDLVAAGISGRVNWHSFRKAAATILAMQGVPATLIAKHTRHESLQVLQRSYIDAEAAGVASAVASLPRV